MVWQVLREDHRDAAVRSNRGRLHLVVVEAHQSVTEIPVAQDGRLMLPVRLGAVLPPVTPQAMGQVTAMDLPVSARLALTPLRAQVRPMGLAGAVRRLAMLLARHRARAWGVPSDCFPDPSPSQSMGGRLAARSVMSPVQRQQPVFLLSFQLVARLVEPACHAARRQLHPRLPASLEQDCLFHRADRQLLFPA